MSGIVRWSFGYPLATLQRHATPNANCSYKKKQQQQPLMFSKPSDAWLMQLNQLITLLS